MQNTNQDIILAAQYPVMKSILLALLLALTAINAYSANFETSDAIDIPINEGFNKVLQLSNGNTFLFHFNARKSMVAKLFDSSRKEISSVKFLGKRVDMSMLETSEMHGIYQIGNEAVVFVSQAILNNVTLLAIRFNITTGKLIAETALIESPSYKNRNEYSLVKNKATGGYAVFCMKDLAANFQEKLYLKVFNDKHEQVKEVELLLGKDNYDEISHINTHVGDDGEIVVTMVGKKIIHYPDVNDRYLAVCYLPAEQDTFLNVVTKIPDRIAPYYSAYSFNKFGYVLNILLVNAQTGYYDFGLQKIEKILYTPLMLRFKQSNLGDMQYNHVRNLMANKRLQEETDTTQFVSAVPIFQHTNKYGLSTVISEENEQNIRVNGVTTNYTLSGNILITYYNDNGEEVWGTVIPKKQFVRNRVTAYELRMRGLHKKAFRRADPYSDWINQFISFYPIVTDTRSCYVIYNETLGKVNSTIADGADTVSTDASMPNYILNNDAIYYKVDRKKETSKEKLFDAGSSKESYAAMIEGADYNETSKVFACAVIHQSDGKYTTRLAWRKLEE